MKVIEQLVGHLRCRGSLSEADVSWLRDQGFLSSAAEYNEYDTEFYDDDDWDRLREIQAGMDEQELIGQLEQDRVKRSRVRGIPKSSKGARKARIIRKLIGAHGKRKRVSVRAAAEKSQILRLKSSCHPSAIPALREALNDPRPAVVAAALEVLILVGLPRDIGFVERLKMLENRGAEVAIAVAKAKQHLFPPGSPEVSLNRRQIQWK